MSADLCAPEEGGHQNLLFLTVRTGLAGWRERMGNTVEKMGVLRAAVTPMWLCVTRLLVRTFLMAWCLMLFFSDFVCKRQKIPAVYGKLRKQRFLVVS